MRPVKCVKCSAENPDSSKYCGQCGALNAAEDLRIRDLAASVFEEQFKKRDQKLIEAETVYAIYKGLARAAWPVALVVAIAAWFGWGKYNNALEAIESAKTAAVKGIQEQTVTEAQSIQHDSAEERASLQKSAQREAKSLRDESSRFQKQYAQDSATLETDLEQSRAKLKAKDAELGVLLTQGTALRTQYDNAISGLTSNSVVTQPINPNDTPGLRGTIAQPKVYSLNSSGSEVEKIQTRLKQLNCYVGEVTGNYDVHTKEAVERFNRYRGEAFPSGVVDETVCNLFSTLITPARTPIAGSSASVISRAALSSVYPAPPGMAVNCIVPIDQPRGRPSPQPMK